MPNLNVPAGKEHFNPGFGASASLDWAFLPISNKIKLGASISGAMANFPVDYSSAFSIIEAGIGPFVQWRFSDRFSLRADFSAGFYRYNWENSGAAKFFTGFSFSAQFHMTPFLSLFAETGYAWHSFSDKQPINNLRIGAGIQFNLNELLRPEARLRGEKTGQQRIFPVIFAWYENNSIAMLRITNGESNAITNMHLSFLLERYMNQAHTFISIERLGPGESFEVPVKAMFNESMLNLKDAVMASSRVIAEYRSLGIKKTAVFQTEMQIFNRNNITWDDDRRAASFVSPRDPAAVYFARYVASTLSFPTESRGTPRFNIPDNICRAAALFETLRLYNTSYIIDPASSYMKLSENAAALDTLNYPYETLMYRGGDCDDLSILFASLLEVLNIESAFITIPGHIFIALDIGDDLWRKGSADVIEQAGKRWLPVEITLVNRGFAEACQTGARQWQRSGNEARLYPMHDNWLIYPPVSVSAAGDHLPSMPGRANIVKAFEAALETLRQ
jgi:hypothetical protein